MTDPLLDFSLALGRVIEVLSLRDIREHAGSPEQDEIEHAYISKGLNAEVCRWVSIWE